MIALLGSWCEGEMRSGQPWPTVLRVYWHQALSRLGREVRRLAAGDCTSWGLPLTATEEERLLTESRTDFQSAIKSGTNFQSIVNSTKKSPSSSLIGIASKKRESFEWLSSLCRERDYPTLWLRGPRYPVVEGLSTILFDGTDFRGTEFDALQKLIARYPDTRRIVLMDFPRVEDHDRLIKAGAVTVLSKPIHVEELYEVVGAGD
jgi:CheY-like chemotaxis protein